MNRIRKGDHVVVITGKQGQRGDVLRVAATGSTFPTSTWSSATPSPTRANQPGGIIEREARSISPTSSSSTPARARASALASRRLRMDAHQVFRSSNEAVDA